MVTKKLGVRVGHPKRFVGGVVLTGPVSLQLGTPVNPNDITRY